MRRLFIFVLCLLCHSDTFADEWPGFRGPRGDGTSSEKNLPTKWSATENVHWKTAIPGKGHSSPIVFGDRLFLTTCIEDDDQRVLICLDRRTGKVQWQRVVVTSKLEPKHRLNSYASSTPVTDGTRVWVPFFDRPHMRVFCYDVDGKKVWEQKPGEFHSRHGFCSSPVLYKDKVIINGDQDALAYIVALDRKTGRELWRIDRPNKTRSYCVPTIFEVGGRTQMVLSGSKCVASYDPNTGKRLWIIDGPTDQMVASVIQTRDVFFVTGGFPQLHILGIPVTAKGELSESDILWRTKNKPVSYVPSPVADGGRFFVVSDRGYASCFDAKTGTQHWMEKMGKRHSSSLIAADGHVYFMADNGECWVVKSGMKFQVVAQNKIGESCDASIAVSRGQLFIRGGEHLYCIGKPQTASR